MKINRLFILTLLATATVFTTGSSPTTEHEYDYEYAPTQFNPKVTALYSLNAELAKSGNEVFYVPKIEELPNIKNTVADVLDFRKQRHKFAAVYDGYFNPAVHEALVRKQDGTFTQIPKAVQRYGNNSLRELNILGYDALLTSEGITNISTENNVVRADYVATTLDNNTPIDLGTSVMGLYKAVGQPKYDITYMMVRDDSLKLETSPIQGEISGLAQSVSIDTSAGKTYVFSTRSNPELYWKQAVQDGIVYDADIDSKGVVTDSNFQSSSTKSSSITLGEFCSYAFNIMHIYGEPVMTESEKNILLQLYGSSVPYKYATDDQITAIENLIAKGIISPDDDEKYLQFSSKLSLEYYLTLLMRIKDVDSRKTYKDVQITMDVELIGKNFYQANLSSDYSPIEGFVKAQSAVSVSNYFDYELEMSSIRAMADQVGGTTGVDSNLYIASHLAFVDQRGKVFPLNTQVSTYSKRIYSPNHEGKLNEVTYDPGKDGQLIPFGISEGVRGDKLYLRIVAFDINELLVGGKYRLVLLGSNNKVSNSSFEISPGGGSYSASGTTRSYSTSSDNLLTQEDLVRDFSNEAEIEEVVEVYNSQGREEALQLYREYIDTYGDSWTAEEKAALRLAASDGIGLEASQTSVYYLKIQKGSEQNINVRDPESNTVKTLAEIMESGIEQDGARFIGSTATGVSVVKLSDTVYQLNNCPSNVQGIFEGRSGSQVSSFTAYSYRNEELLVGTDWLKEVGLITATPIERGSTLMLTTELSNIFIDRDKKQVLVGSVMYDLKSITSDKKDILWYKTDSGAYFVNFRAIIGWTGDFLVFKQSGNRIAVTTDSALANSSSTRLQNAFLRTYNHAKTNGFSTRLQVPKGQGDAGILMTSNTQITNWIVYINKPVLGENGTESLEDKDWLFVFKSKKIFYNNQNLSIDDSEARQIMSQRLGIDANSIDSDLLIYAYPLYKSPSNYDKGMPQEMSWTENYGYIYKPERISSMDDFYANYFKYAGVPTANRPKHVLPLIQSSTGGYTNLNFNTATVKGADGSEKQLPYGQMPYKALKGSDETESNFDRMYYTVTGTGTAEILVNNYDFTDVSIYPAVTAPIMWLAGLESYDFNSILLSNNKKLLYGTMEADIALDSNNNRVMRLGHQDMKSEDVSKLKFAITTDLSGGLTIYSSTVYTAFKLNESLGGNLKEALDSLGKGLIDGSTDVLKWNEYKMDRAIETLDFGVAAATIFSLNIIPIISMSIFLLLIMLSYIQHMKWWELFCIKIFDPYKFLTFGRKDVHTFNGMRMFLLSIVGMAVFALFMDGNILRIYSWIAEWFAVVSNR